MSPRRTMKGVPPINGRLTPISHADLVRTFRVLGFRPKSHHNHGSHVVFERGAGADVKRVPVPNHHKEDLSVDGLKRILTELGLTPKQFNLARHGRNPKS